MRISDWSSDVCSSDLRLADIRYAERVEHRESSCDVLLRLFVGPMDSEQSCIRHEFRKDRLQPADAKAFALDLVDHRAEQAVMAQRLATDTRRKGERPRIRPKHRTRPPPHMAPPDNLLPSQRLLTLQRLTRGTNPEPI